MANGEPHDDPTCQECLDSPNHCFHCLICGVHLDTTIPKEHWMACCEMCPECIKSDNKRRLDEYEASKAKWTAEMIEQIASGADQTALFNRLYDERSGW